MAKRRSRRRASERARERKKPCQCCRTVSFLTLPPTTGRRACGHGLVRLEPLLTDLLVGVFGGFFLLIKKTLPPTPPTPTAPPHPPTHPKHCFYRLYWPCLVERDSFWSRSKSTLLRFFCALTLKKTFNMSFK